MLPKDYISVHVRNTDYKSDYKSFYQINKKNFENKNIFFATDDFEALEFFQNCSKKDNFKLFHFANIPKIKCHAMHINNKNLKPKEILHDCIADFFLLCLGSLYYYSCDKSGFSINIQKFRIYNKIDSILKFIF